MFKKTGLGLILLVFLAGCSGVDNTTTEKHEQANGKALTVETSELVDTELEALLLKMLNQTQDNLPLQKVEIQHTDVIDDLIVLTFVYVNDLKETFHGIFTAYKQEDQSYSYRDLEAIKRYEKEDVSFFNYGAIKEGTVRENMRIISGYLNHKSIRKIVIQYVDGITKTVPIEEGQETFTVIKIGGKGSQDSVQALSKTGKVIYERTYP